MESDYAAVVRDMVAAYDMSQEEIARTPSARAAVPQVPAPSLGLVAAVN